MRSQATTVFWKHFSAMPPEIQRTARRRFRLWRSEPFHPSLHFKQLYASIWSVRVTDDYRALALREQDRMVWFWVGTHADYNHILARRQR